eukprot:TRINITY_DN2675_c0_g1_i2.p3 TRINITY_DN2675_c0_g1~~TRINITY_DN2675_c0_g1_i2.p3  ORF type:complete len:104 (+),score=14.21 TRINITY_DN2675_c0_g1_i2:403-714(+)
MELRPVQQGGKRRRPKPWEFHEEPWEVHEVPGEFHEEPLEFPEEPWEFHEETQLSTLLVALNHRGRVLWSVPVPGAADFPQLRCFEEGSVFCFGTSAYRCKFD